MSGTSHIIGKYRATPPTLTDGQVSQANLDVNSRLEVSVVPGTGATNLGKAEDAAHSSGDTGVMMLAVRNDSGTVLAGTSGDYIPLSTDANGNEMTSLGTQIEGEDSTNHLIKTQNYPIASSTYAWSVDRSTALEASTVTKATPGVIRYISCRLDSTAPTGTYYLQVLNAASLPADGAVTTLVAPTKINHTLGVDDAINIDCTMNGVYASTGIVVCLSTTEYTKTISGAYTSSTILYV